MASYGGLGEIVEVSPLELVLEELSLKGFSMMKSVFSTDEVEQLRDKVLEIYQKQEEHFSRDELIRINDQDTARNIISHNDIFNMVIDNKDVKHICKEVLHDNYMLSLSNAVINKSNNPQTRWHRDLPYQNFICDEFLGLNVFITLDEFTVENGATQVIPFSNKFKQMPSKNYIEENTVSLTCPAGSILFFDSMIIHRSGDNVSKNSRIGLNFNFIRPFLKPQYTNIENQSLVDDVFGKRFDSAKDDYDFRNKRLTRDNK